MPWHNAIQNALRIARKYADGGFLDPNPMGPEQKFKTAPHKSPNQRVGEGHQEFEPGYLHGWEYEGAPIMNMRGQHLTMRHAADGGNMQRTEGFPEKPEGYEFYGPDDTPGDSPIATEKPVAQAAPSVPTSEGMPAYDPAQAPHPGPPTIMEPDLQSAQTGQVPDLDPEKYGVDEHGRIIDKKTWEPVQLTRRPNVLPITKTPEGQPEFAMPKALDIAGNLGGGWNVPVRGAESILGAGMAFPKKVPAIPPKAGEVGRTWFDLPPEAVTNAKWAQSSKGTSPAAVLTGFTDGQDRYVKVAKSLDHAKNEVLASKLYELAGVPVAKTELTQMAGKPAVASRMIDGKQLSEFDPWQYEHITNLDQHMPADAWLANGDVIGAGVENPKGNILVKPLPSGMFDATRIDFGGALRYSGLGAPKTFDKDVGKWLTGLKDEYKNPTAAEAFYGHKIGPENATAQRIAAISDTDLMHLVYQYGPTDMKAKKQLLDTLVARRDAIAKAYGVEQIDQSKRAFVKGMASSMAASAMPGKSFSSVLSPASGDGWPLSAVLKFMQSKSKHIDPKYGSFKNLRGLIEKGGLSAPPGGIHQMLDNLSHGIDPIIPKNVISKYASQMKIPINWDKIYSSTPKITPASNVTKPEFKTLEQEMEELLRENKKLKKQQIEEPGTSEWNPSQTPQLSTPILMKLNKLSKPDELVYAVKNQPSTEAVTNKKVTTKQANKILEHFSNANAKSIAQTLIELDPAQQANAKTWMSPNTVKAVDKFLEDTPKLMADMLLKKHGDDTEQLAKALYEIASYKKPELADDIYKKLPLALHVDVEADLSSYIRNKQYDPWDPHKFKGPADEQAEYEAKQAMQSSHEAALASGQAGGDFQYTGKKVKPTGPLPDSAFQEIHNWVEWKPKEKYAKPPYLHNITPEEAKKRGFNPNFAMYRGEKYHHGATHENPYPTEFPIAKDIKEPEYFPERAIFTADLSHVSHNYGVVGDYIMRATKAAEVDWKAINGYRSYSNETMHRIIEAAHERGYDVLAIHGMSDMGSTNHTQYAILNTAGLRSTRAKFEPNKLHLRFPHAGLVGGGLLTYGMLRGQEGDESKMARGGQIMPLKPGNSPEVKSQNIKEFHTGKTYAHTKAKFGKAKADKQAIAVALSTARKYAKGGDAMSGLALKGSSIGLSRQAGMIHSSIPGRTDKIPMKVKAGSYILPADIPSALGQGNTMAGGEILKKMFNSGPYGMTPMKGHGRPRIPKKGFQEGGEVEEESDDHVPIIAAGGEYEIPPEVVRDIGHGNMKAGHDVLDKFVLKVRKHHIETLKKLPGPKK